MANDVVKIEVNTEQIDKAIAELKQLQKASKDVFSLENKNTTKSVKNFTKNNKILKDDNKDLQKKSSLLKDINKQLNVTNLLAGGLAGLGIGLGISAVKSTLDLSAGMLEKNLKAKNLGISLKDMQSLNFAEGQTGIQNDQLVNTIQQLNINLRDFEKHSSFASLGVDISKAQKMNPVDAMFEIFHKIQKSELNEDLKRKLVQDIGIPFDELRSVLLNGAGELQSAFRQGQEIYKKAGDQKTLLDLGKSTGILMAQFDALKGQLATKLAPALTDLFKSISKFLESDTMKQFFIFIEESIGTLTKMIEFINSTETGVSKKTVKTGMPIIDHTLKASRKGTGGVYAGHDQVDDAVITSKGDVIHTSPEDYILATKHPENLMAGGGNFNININASVRDDADIVAIRNELNNLISNINMGGFVNA